MNNRKYTQSIYQTSTVNAIYTPQVNPMHQSNPTIECMENHLEAKRIMKLGCSLPPYSDDFRMITNKFDRMSMLVSYLGSWREAVGTDVSLYIQILNLINNGHIRNNPLKPAYWGDLDPAERLTLFSDLIDSTDYICPTAHGFFVLGDSGLGKSTSIEQTIRILRQVIIHDFYKGQPFPFRQITAVIVSCPYRGGLLVFLKQFFHCVDNILRNTAYYKRYVKRDSTVPDLKRAMRKVCLLHGIGVIIIDETQNLVTSKSGFEGELLNFFTTFDVEVGFPLILIGTPAVKEVWEKSFSAGRRIIGDGPIEFERFRRDASPEGECARFCVNMFHYQFTRERTLLTAEIFYALYDVTQGIPDLMKTAFQFAQAYAIEFEFDDAPLTGDDFRAIAGKFGSVDEALKAVREGNFKLVADKFKDLSPKDVNIPRRPDSDIEAPHPPITGQIPSANGLGAEDVTHSEPTKPQQATNPLYKKTKKAIKKLNEDLDNPPKDKGEDPTNTGYDELNNEGLIGFDA